MKRSLQVIGTLLIGASLLVAGCAGGDDDADVAMEAGAATTAAAEATTTMASELAPRPPGSDDAEEAVGTAAQAAPASVDPAELGRKIVYTANLEVEVEDVIAAGEQVEAAVAGLGGVLFGQETSIGDRPYSVLTIKVPPENFREALSRLAGIGKLRNQQVYADDVTERVVDLESRITTAQASVERLRSFLADAESVEAVAELESQLLERETALELLRGQLRTLESQVSLATIVLTLREPVPPEPEPALEMVQTGYLGWDRGASCPGAESLRVDEGEAITVCYQLTNTGDTGLIDVEVRDRGLRADEDDLLVVEGDLDAVLAPEGSLILIFETEAEPKRFPDPAIEVTAVDADGEPIRVGVEVDTEVLGLRVDEDESLPGLTDAMKKAWEGLQWLFGVAVVGAGVLIPFLWVPALGFGAYWFLRRRRAGEAAGAPEPGSEPAREPEAGADRAEDPEGTDASGTEPNEQ